MYDSNFFFIIFFSNGTGKSSLAMSALWALTGSIDPRPVQDDKVSDIVNDLSKVRILFFSYGSA